MAQPNPTQYELEARWITDEGIPGVHFRFGDLARIKAGERSGQIGEVIALLWLDPKPSYMLELRDGKSVTLAQHELEPTGSCTGRKLTLVKPK